MPLYDYRCPSGHVTETIRSYANRHDCPRCRCGAETSRVFPAPHVEPDGVYSYAPNLGTEETFERRRHAIREGVKMIKKEIPNE